jgi:mitogen-activated protein kinase 15
LGSKNYGTAADIWSIGCILVEILIGKPFFPGNSTLNQLERILAFTGHPTQKDINSLEADCAETMIKSVNVSKVRPIKEWFKSDTSMDAIDLVKKMLEFNPDKRIKMEEILKHPYVAQFRDSRTEIESRKSIRPPVSDNKKLNLKQYRNLIYESIKKIFNPHEERLMSM